ncbi:proline racemase family protein [Glycomyces algeriensis]|uniref:Proline racemase n=1 Tax=Glycomyces algeriensis TaxID=256037 RepID=A0A9W6GB62_9ACTN|nr:proline racemase family protein [Glycomyces algeriensis]MDA1368836.1 proline racemase family protein [Glycomyces algeriensis]MDR7350852.1 proline racemase [Glycomyces algeriensis]GLI43563.1 proline racemase [Glycomyces algeriensis]
MRSRLVLQTVESHTEGMPTRVVTGGVGAVPGATMMERRNHLRDHDDHIRQFLMNEPRGHAAMSGAILQPPTRPDADWGVLFIEVSGYLPMCGHGTIGVATVLCETGMVPVTEPITTVRLDTPAGLVTVDVRVEDGSAKAVTLVNVPAFSVGLDRTVHLKDGREIRYDLAFGGNFYAFVDLDDLGLPFDRAAKNELIAAGLDIMAAVNAEAEPVHPLEPSIRGLHHVYLTAPGSDAKHSRHAMAIHPGWFDRSPCGTGTSARMAQLHARGLLDLDQDFVNESFIGSRFTGRLIGETEVAGIPAVVPSVTGRAWITGTAQYTLDPDDPFPSGFIL